MGEHDFQQEVIDRLARIETKQDATMVTVADHVKTLIRHGERITVAEESVKSAHHRINTINTVAAGVGAVAGWLANLVAQIWPRGSN